jgi:hypothetical protein
VSLDSLEHLAGWDAVRSALAEIQASHGELEQFFSAEFAQLDSLGRELMARQEQFEQKFRSPAPQDGAAAATSQRQLEELLEETRRQQGELRNMQAMLKNELALLSVSAELGASPGGSSDVCAQTVQHAAFEAPNTGLMAVC